MNSIFITAPIVTDSSEGYSRINYGLYIKNELVYTVYYEVESEYKEYLCTERADGIVVNLLLYAMYHGYNIESETAVSEKLLYKLNSYLIPAISKNIKQYTPIKITAPIDSTIFSSGNAVGASISGGVDSFYTMIKHLNRKEAHYNVTHVGFYNAGASGATGGEWARERYKARIEWIREVATELDLKMVCVDTNINEFLKQDHEPSHTFRTLAIPLVLQKLFSKYLFASGFEFSDFKIDYKDTAPYDVLSLSCLTNENLEFVLSGAEASRIEKLAFISDYHIVNSKLNVCTAEVHNCGKCDKCRRTILGLYSLNKLDAYRDSFDVDYFKKHKHQYYYLMMAMKNWKQCAVKHEWEEIYQAVKSEITLRDRCGGCVLLWYRKLRRIVYRTAFGKRIYKLIKG